MEADGWKTHQSKTTLQKYWYNRKFPGGSIYEENGYFNCSGYIALRKAIKKKEDSKPKAKEGGKRKTKRRRRKSKRKRRKKRTKKKRKRRRRRRKKTRK